MLHQTAETIFNSINLPENLLQLVLSSQSENAPKRTRPEDLKPSQEEAPAKKARSLKPKKKQKTKKRETVKNNKKKVNFELQGNSLFIII